MSSGGGVRRWPPILNGKRYASPPVFRPENLLREARRQRRLPTVAVPEVCILDPDGDIFRTLGADGRGLAFKEWAWHHTEMLVAELGGIRVGVVGFAVGAPFAVLVAEEMFASGCRLLLSVTSSGRIAQALPDDACFVLIDRALRDEGTSYHYLPADDFFAHADPDLAGRAMHAIGTAGLPALRGAVWTTDAPFRETEEAIAWAAKQDVLAVEMEAAALYAFAQARSAAVLCFAHVTNRMARVAGNVEKAEAVEEALRLLGTVAASLHGPA